MQNCEKKQMSSTFIDVVNAAMKAAAARDYRGAAEIALNAAGRALESGEPGEAASLKVAGAEYLSLAGDNTAATAAYTDAIALEPEVALHRIAAAAHYYFQLEQPKTAYGILEVLAAPPFAMDAEVRHQVAILSGRFALNESRIDDAVRDLTTAGREAVIAAMPSFMWDLQLVADLIKRGHRSGECEHYLHEVLAVAREEPNERIVKRVTHLLSGDTAS
ncbi:MAG TPA: hypothetical protein VGJ82_00345 [Thermoanaerobaculia bacterium]|jgi:hypothetical protein